MTFAKIPEDAKILLQPGTARPKETEFESKIPFKICWVITDGKNHWEYLLITRKSSGIYIVFPLPGGFHESYHADGNHHWRLPHRLKIPLSKGSPLDSLRNYVSLNAHSADITSEVLLRQNRLKFTFKSVDQVIYLDNRRWGPWINSHIYLVEPFKHGEIPLRVDRPFYYHLTTHTIPWILVVIYEGSQSQGQPHSKRRKPKDK